MKNIETNLLLRQEITDFLKVSHAHQSSIDIHQAVTVSDRQEETSREIFLMKKDGLLLSELNGKHAVYSLSDEGLKDYELNPVIEPADEDLNSDQQEISAEEKILEVLENEASEGAFLTVSQIIEAAGGKIASSTVRHTVLRIMRSEDCPLERMESPLGNQYRWARSTKKGGAPELVLDQPKKNKKQSKVRETNPTLGLFDDQIELLAAALEAAPRQYASAAYFASVARHQKTTRPPLLNVPAWTQTLFEFSDNAFTITQGEQKVLLNSDDALRFMAFALAKKA